MVDPDNNKANRMSKLFGNVTNQGLEKTTDTLGGYAPLPSGIYSGTVKAIYAGKADSGAMSLTVMLDLGGQEMRETIYVTNRKGENWFLNKQDTNKKIPLPGYTTANDICLVTTGLSLDEQVFEDKILNIYDPENRKEMPKSVPVMVEAIGKPLSVAVLNVLENKSVKDANTGAYVDTAETRNSNIIDKVFDTETKMTVSEAQEEKPGGIFWKMWEERNGGKVRDKRTIKDGAGGANSGKPLQRPTQGGAATGGEPRKSLFGKPK